MSLKGFHRDATSSIDTPEDILKCLNCTKPKCNNCLFASHVPHAVTRSKRSKQVKELHEQHYTDNEIAEIMGVSTPTVRYYRLELGLEANRKRKIKKALKK